VDSVDTNKQTHTQIHRKTSKVMAALSKEQK